MKICGVPIARIKKYKHIVDNLKGEITCNRIQNLPPYLYLKSRPVHWKLCPEAGLLVFGPEEVGHGRL